MYLNDTKSAENIQSSTILNYNENGATKTMIEWILLLSLIGLIILRMQIKDYTYPSQIQKEIIKEFENQKKWE